ncbi:MAG TPA: hypothetical protein ENI23_14065 [bacterium]|nr:hypothetical protein [bacterium]
MALLKTSSEIAHLRSQFTMPESPELILLKKNLSCKGMHNEGGYPLEGVTEHRVDRMYVHFYEPRLGVVRFKNDGLVDPLQIIKAAGCHIDQQVCLHRNENTGDYMVFQKST